MPRGGEGGCGLSAASPPPHASPRRCVRLLPFAHAAAAATTLRSREELLSREKRTEERGPRGEVDSGRALRVRDSLRVRHRPRPLSSDTPPSPCDTASRDGRFSVEEKVPRTEARGLTAAAHVARVRDSLWTGDGGGRPHVPLASPPSVQCRRARHRISSSQKMIYPRLSGRGRNHPELQCTFECL